MLNKMKKKAVRWKINEFFFLFKNSYRWRQSLIGYEVLLIVLSVRNTTNQQDQLPTLKFNLENESETYSKIDLDKPETLDKRGNNFA